MFFNQNDGLGFNSSLDFYSLRETLKHYKHKRPLRETCYCCQIGFITVIK